MAQDDVLSGFSAVFETINRQQNEPDNLGNNEPSVDDDSNSLLNNIFRPTEDQADTDVDDYKPDEGGFNKQVQGTADAGDASSDGGYGDEGQPEGGMSDVVSTFFDAIAETAGWSDITDEEKPKTVEALVEFMQSVVESNSTPSYANDEIAAMDEYVRNGGTIEDYMLKAGSSADISNIDISIESNQKRVVREFLLEKGFTEEQIKRKLEKYEDADILEDEAADAVESLREIRAEKQKALLEEQKSTKQRMINEQQEFYNNVVNEIEALTDIRGVQIPKNDKQILMDYIFKVEPDGRTKYQKDYASSTKHLIESAYFTMKGDALISTANKTGETSAVEKLKNTLNSTKVSGSKQRIDNRSAQPLWSVASSQLLRRPQ